MEDKTLKFVQVVTIIAETYAFENPTKEGYDANTEQFFVQVGDNTTVFPREAVIAFRAVYEDEDAKENAAEEAEIVDIFGYMHTKEKE